MQLLENIELTEVKRFPSAVCYIAKNNPQVLVVQPTTSSMPKTHFQEIFISLVPVIVAKDIKKLVYDSRKLVDFNQSTMEWFFLVFQEAMQHRGLNHYRILLPTDSSYVENERNGRTRIAQMSPNGRYKEVDLQYSHSLEEAVEQ